VAVVEDYCRDVEAYLCRKNDGHLIRIVGPAFEQVCEWAARGVPLTVAKRGIDRYFDRYYAKGPRRRPVRVEFCEADVLDVFDEWRRALGIAVAAPPEGPPAFDSAQAGEGGPRVEGGLQEDGRRSRHHESLPAHLARVVARLTALRAGADRSLDSTVDQMVSEIDTAHARSKSLRGEARRALVDRLRELDRVLLDAAYAHCDQQVRQALEAEADAELAPFRGRMTPEAYEQSRRAACDRLLRERRGLPLVAFE
jgi:hypothetical protein